MGHCVRLILPDVPEKREALDGLIRTITECWGGVTSWMASGRWNGAVEDVHVVECSVGAWTPQIREWWSDLATDAALLLDQRYIYLSVRSETALLIGLTGEETIGD